MIAMQMHNAPQHMMRHFDPSRFSSELLFTAIVVILCFIIYFKTKEIYDLSKHKGIYYFRNAFLFFGLAYLARFLFNIFMISGNVFDLIPHKQFLMPFMLIPTGYFGSMAIFYSVYSMIWKKIKEQKFLWWSNLVAVVLTTLSVVSRSPEILAILQSALVIFGLIMIMKMPKKQKMRIGVIYLLLYIFWLGSVLTLSGSGFWSFELTLAVQIISISAFLAIYHKLHKWVK